MPELLLDEYYDYIDFCEGYEVPPAEELPEDEVTEEMNQDDCIQESN